MAIHPHNPDRGQRFTHVYLDRGPPVEDSVRVRRRVAAVIGGTRDFEQLYSVVPRELGIEMRWAQFGLADWSAFVREIELGDFLDLITLAYRELVRKQSTGIYDMQAPRRWVAEVSRIFQEENFGYLVDEAGGVHYRLDEEFARNKSAAIAALEGARYANTLDGFMRSMAALAEAPPDGKGAVRGVFAAAEGLFRLVVSNAARLGATELEQLAPILDKVYPADVTARRASSKLLMALKDWTEAAHFYRHEQGAQDIAQPPLNLAVYLVSSGAAHLRWLAQLDTASRAEDSQTT